MSAQDPMTQYAALLPYFQQLHTLMVEDLKARSDSEPTKFTTEQMKGFMAAWPTLGIQFRAMFTALARKPATTALS